MSAIRELGSVDTRENQIFRAVVTPYILTTVKTKLNADLVASLAQNSRRARNISLMLESLDYERFPPVMATLVFLFSRR
jgi:hypothetical protein